jgi:hypothetical protein
MTLQIVITAKNNTTATSVFEETEQYEMTPDKEQMKEAVTARLCLRRPSS